ncbi:MAG: hypothetical protein JWO06_646 [Bacteroidota bacterium]|nr:hypothetical protein [Bacteroidota bacterium]
MRFVLVIGFNALFYLLPAKDVMDSVKAVVKRTEQCDCGKPPFYVSPVFSPNCESNYCIWFDINFAVDTVQLSFYNRWGTKCKEFDLNCPANTLDEINNGLEQKLNESPAIAGGSYVYILTLTLPTGKQVKYCNTLTIIR